MARASRRRHQRGWPLVLVAVVGVLAATAPPGWASELEERESHVEQELSDADSQLHQSTEALDEATQAYREAEAALPRADAALAEAEAALANAKSELAQANGKVAVAKAEDALAAHRLADAEERVREQLAKVAAITAEIDAKRADISGLAVGAYQKGSAGQLSGVALVLGADSLGDLAARAGFASSAMNATNEQLREMQSARARLANERARLDELRAEAEELRVAAAEHLEQTEELQAAAQVAADDAAAHEAAMRAAKEAVDGLVEAREHAVLAAEAAKEEDAAAYARLEVERSTIDEQIAELAQTLDADADRQPSSPGRRLAGSATLGYPVAEPFVTSPYGMRTHPITGVRKLHDGTDLRASCGTPIHATQSGTVQWTDSRGAYGNQVMINHGDVDGMHLMSSYSHLDRFAVSAGSQVERGQVIGYSGSTGYSTGCHLHFMVYANGERANPMVYLQ